MIDYKNMIYIDREVVYIYLSMYAYMNMFFFTELVMYIDDFMNIYWHIISLLAFKYAT